LIEASSLGVGRVLQLVAGPQGPVSGEVDYFVVSWNFDGVLADEELVVIRLEPKRELTS
jgi:hypothetical protein